MLIDFYIQILAKEKQSALIPGEYMSRAAETRIKILEQAKRLYSQTGYFDTQISDIIREAKIGRGTVYQYFKNKEDIFLTLLEIFYKEWEQESSTNFTIEELASMSPKEYLRRRIDQTLNYFASDNDRTNIILRISLGLGGDFEISIKKIEKRITTIITNDLKLAIHNGHVDKDLDLDLASNFIAGALFRVSYFYFARNRRQKQSRSLEVMAEKITELVASGIF